MKDKLIELIESGRGCPDDRAPFLDEHCLGCRYCDEKDCDIVRLADYLMEHGVTVQKWIPVSERLPEDVYGKYREQIVVLVSTKSGKVSQCARMADYERIENETHTQKLSGLKMGSFIGAKTRLSPTGSRCPKHRRRRSDEHPL